MIKLLTNSYDFGTPGVELVHPRGGPLVKSASAEMQDFLKTVQAEDGKTKLLVLAMGAGESYGCFAAGTPIAEASGHYFPIEDLEIGDRVVSADGGTEEVTHLFQRTIAQGLELAVAGVPGTLKCSLDHPFRVARFEQFVCCHDKYKRCLPPLQGEQSICKRSGERDCVGADFPDVLAEFATANTLRVGDFLVWTAPKSLPPAHIEADEAYLIGAWLAEGSFVRHRADRRATSLQLSIHLAEREFETRIANAAAAVGMSFKSYPQTRDTTRQLNIAGDPERARRYEGWFGGRATEKRLPPWFCSIPKKSRLALLAGYVDGDGSCSVTEKENRTTVRTHSRALALGVQRLCWSLGFPAVVCPVRGTIGYNLSLANSYLAPLVPYSWKVRPRPLLQTTKIHGFFHQGRMYLPVRGLVEITEPFKVFNLEVSGSHTYSGPNVDSHNCNRNGDWFGESDLIRHHDTFEKYAKLYRHHVNKDPEKSYGDVEKSAYNRAMRRVELIVSVDNAKAPDIVKKANAGEDIPVSMSCKVAYDVCSICEKKSSQVSDYCGHLKEAMTKIQEDGRQVCARNPNPTFFDISVVYKPADRIAYVLEKVAHSGAVPSALIAQELGLTEYDFVPRLFDKRSHEVQRKRTLLKKLAAIEKEIEGILQKPKPETPKEEFVANDAPKALVIVLPAPGADASGGSIRHMLGGLAEHGVIVSPQEFSGMMGKGLGAGISGLLPGIFSRLLDSPGLDNLLGRGLFDFDGPLSSGLPKSLLQELAANRSLHHRPASRRVMKLTLSRPRTPKFRCRPGGAGPSATTITIEKVASDPAYDLAIGYALYKLSAFEKAAAGHEGDELLPLLTVLQNYLVE